MTLRVLLIACALFLGVSAEATTLTLRSEARVSGANVTVGDVVAVDANLPAALLEIPLGSSPDLNGKAPFSRELVAGAIAAATAAHPELGKVDVAGSSSCLVSRPGRIVSPENLSGVILMELQKAVGNQGMVKIEEFAPTAPVNLPTGQIGAQAQLDPGALLHPWAMATINYYIGREMVGTSSVRFRWSWQRQAYQAVRNIQAGEAYNPIDFRLTTIDAIRSQGNYMTQLPTGDDHVIARQISTGQLLMPSYLAPKKIVQRGDHVTVNYVESNLKVTLRAVALQDGVKGQTISVQNASSQKSLFAKVVNADTLEMVQ